MKTGDTLLAIDQLVVQQCPTCDIWHAIPVEMERRMKDDRGPQGKQAYCPKGHAWHFLGKTKLEEEREKRQRAEQDADEAWNAATHSRAEAEHARNRVRGYQGALAKTKKRIAAGSCPACQQRFPDVAEHMAAEHPGYGESSGSSG